MRADDNDAHQGNAPTPRRRTTSYWLELDRALGARAYIEFTIGAREVIDYAVVLLVKGVERMETVRVYDGAHGINELHRHTRRGGKQQAVIAHRGNLGVGMRTAIEAVRYGYRSMIEGWRDE